MKTIPNYHPPSDYRRPTKTQEKVYVPVNDYPEINFSMLANPLTSLTILHIPCLGVYERHDLKPATALCLTGRSCPTLTHSLLSKLELHTEN
jgi:hypothetical protein